MAESMVRLSDLCNIVSEPVAPRERPDAVYVGLEHLATGRFTRIGAGRASDVRSSKSTFKSGDILYGKLRPYLDKAALAQDEGICSTDLLVLRPKKEVNPRFLVGVVHAPAFVEYAVSGTSGVQHPRTSWAHIQEFLLPEQVFEEQDKVAALLWLVHDVIAACEITIATAYELKRAAMQQLFTRGLRGEAQKETEIGPIPESWEAKSIAALTNVVYRYPSYYKIDYVGSGVPEVRGELLRDTGEIESDLSQFRFIDTETASRFPKVRLETGDIVMSVRGTMGKIGIARNIHIGAVITANLIRLAPDRQKISPEFFKFVLTSERFSRALDMASPQTTIKTITSPVLKSLRLPTPPTLDEQSKIVAILDAIDRKSDLHRRKRAVLDDLFKALLHNLMTGEIRVEGIDLSALHCDVEKATERFNKSPLLRC